MTQITVTPSSIYEYLPYLNDHIADVRRNGDMSKQALEDLNNHKASAIIDFFDFAQNIPQMHWELELKFCRIVARNFERGWTTKFDTEDGRDIIVTTKRS